ncbi:ankyrin repeat domain-containing protein 50 isoform X1 [Macrosteles quadrilineatus]|uniref:ankyrin repeat domain-containing protein 50 isoform X1 n=2 Tax=Macrosteles quadrilineatus TaxID=74068 RepID=UPI0023E21C8E|nr:ankyrin repeat domain-containing protein 50 isoform X1 [Macrosteles quadrilineatus]
MTTCHLERKRFYCREWAFVKLSHCLDQRGSCKTTGAVIVGGPGSGKTALCCEIVWPGSGQSARPQRCLNKRLLAYHFCQAHDVKTLSVTDFIISIAEQLSQKLAPIAEEFSERLKSESEVVSALQRDNIIKSPDDSFRKGIIVPLAEIKPPPSQCYFMLVDSVDESHISGTKFEKKSSNGPSRTIGELLANNHHLFPPWFLLVLTARRQSKTIAKTFSGFRKISLDDLRKSQVVRDVQQYILSRLEWEESLRQHMCRGTAETLNQLHIKSNGCFLYLERVLDGVAEGCIVLREVRDIPGTLNGLYLWLCQRLLSNKHFSKVRPLLNIVLASERPLSEEQVCQCLLVSQPTLSSEELRRRCQVLRRVLCLARDETLRPFHHSFAEWLCDVKHCTQRFLCSPASGHAMLAMQLTLRGPSLSAEEVESLALHLSCLPHHTALSPLLPVWLLDCGVRLDQMNVLCCDPRSAKLIDEANSCSHTPQESEGSCSSPQAELVCKSPMERDLHTLAAENNHQMLETLLTEGETRVDIEETDKHDQTPLNLAARLGHHQVVKVLLSAGANVDHPDADGWTPLRAAAWGGHTQVVEILLEAGANVDYCDADQRTALRAAAWGGHDEIVTLLLKAGADVNKTDCEGRTALIAAAYMGHSDIVETLLEYNADINHDDNDGRTALSVAALCVPISEGYTKVVNILLERGADVDHEDKEGMTPLLVAAFEGHSDICELLLEAEADVDHCDSSGRSPLWVAASMGHTDVVTLLLFWGCTVDTIDIEGRTVLSVASAQGNTSVVNQLLHRGLDEQHRDNSGWTPLHYACLEGHTEVVAALIEGGAQVDQTDNDSRAPLLLAAQEGHTQLVLELLQTYGALVDQRALDGTTAFRLAALQGHQEVVRILLEHGADVNAQDADSRTTLYILALENRVAMAKFLIDPGGADVEARDSEGRTALHVSAWQGHREMVSLLLSHGHADVNATDNERRTALHSAAWQGHYHIVQILLEHNAEPDHTCNQGATPLGIAAQEGHEECVRLLLAVGANPNHSDHCGRNALKVAAKSGHQGVVRLLEQAQVNAGLGLGAVAPPLICPSAPPSCSPESTTKRRSIVSSDSSNLTNSTKSSLKEQSQQSFTHQLERCSRKSRILSPLQSQPPSPIYASPPASPPNPCHDHFSRDTHMRIILGSCKASPTRPVAASKPKRNGIVTNPALRIVPAIKNGLELAAGRKINNATTTNSFQWRKETPL